MGWHRGDRRNYFSAHRMDEGKLVGMEGLAGQVDVDTARGSVEIIPYQRMAHLLTVYPNLVGTARF